MKYKFTHVAMSTGFAVVYPVSLIPEYIVNGFKLYLIISLSLSQSIFNLKLNLFVDCLQIIDISQKLIKRNLMASNFNFKQINWHHQHEVGWQLTTQLLNLCSKNWLCDLFHHPTKTKISQIHVLHLWPQNMLKCNH